VEGHIKNYVLKSMLTHVFWLLKLIYMGFRFKYLIFKIIALAYYCLYCLYILML